VVRERRLSIACRIVRTYHTVMNSLLSDLGFGDVLQILKSEVDEKVSSEEKA
jgi:hypothetical protein